MPLIKRKVRLAIDTRLGCFYLPGRRSATNLDINAAAAAAAANEARGGGGFTLRSPDKPHGRGRSPASSLPTR